MFNNEKDEVVKYGIFVMIEVLLEHKNNDKLRELGCRILLNLKASKGKRMKHIYNSYNSNR